MDFILKAIGNPGDVWNRKTLHGAGWEGQRLGQWSFTAIHSTCPHVQWSQHGHKCPTPWAQGSLEDPTRPPSTLLQSSCTRGSHRNKTWVKAGDSSSFLVPPSRWDCEQGTAVCSDGQGLQVADYAPCPWDAQSKPPWWYRGYRFYVRTLAKSSTLREMPRYLHRNFPSFVFS